MTGLLADHFGQVIGLDPSPEQIANARPHPGVRYLCAAAENIPLPDHSADLITAAQAAHWFDRLAFYAEARRLATPGAVLALISYGVASLDDPALNQRFQRFYHDEIDRFWPPERKLVDGGYAGMDFPFAEIAAPALHIEREWGLAAFLGYISTWSAIRRASDAGQSRIAGRFADELARLWGNERARHLAHQYAAGPDLAPPSLPPIPAPP